METEQKIIVPERPKAPGMVDIYVSKIDDEWARALIPKLDGIAMKSDETTIRFLIDSYGGGLDPILSVAEYLRSLPNPIVTEARSKCYSAGLMLLSCGQERWGHPRTNYLLHQAQVSNTYNGPIQGWGRAVRPVFERNKEFIQLMADNIGADFHELWRASKTDYYFGSDKALELGFIQGIIPDPVRPHGNTT